MTTEKKILQMREGGKTLREIGEACGGVSRQRIWQILKTMSGHCRICGSISEDGYSGFCAKHREDNARGNRKRYRPQYGRYYSMKEYRPYGPRR